MKSLQVAIHSAWIRDVASLCAPHSAGRGFSPVVREGIIGSHKGPHLSLSFPGVVVREDHHSEALKGGGIRMGTYPASDLWT